jgi:hypothetical protein
MDNQQSFEEIIKQKYEVLEANDIKALISEVVDFVKTDEHDDDKIRNIVKSVINSRSISFKQWKALSAYLSDCRRTKNKTF